MGSIYSALFPSDLATTECRWMGRQEAHVGWVTLVGAVLKNTISMLEILLKEALVLLLATM